MIPQDRRAIRVGAIALAAGFLLLRALPAGARWGMQHLQALEAEERLLVETRQLVLSAPTLEDSVAHLTRRIEALAPRLLTGTTGPDAAAALAARVSVPAERLRLTVERVEPVADSLTRADGTLRRATVRVSVVGDLAELLALLDTLGRGDPLLIPAGVQLAATNAPAPADSAEVVRMELTVSGWYLVEERRP